MKKHRALFIFFLLCLVTAFSASGCRREGHPLLRPLIHPLKEKPVIALPEGQEALARLTEKSGSLGMELARLPELSCAMTIGTATALKRLARAYRADPPAFNHAFKRMKAVGLQKNRKYCTPLQALLWAAEKTDGKSLKLLIRTYRLKTLLNLSWDFNEKKRWKDFNIVTDRLNSPELVDFYEKKFFRYQIDRIDAAQPPKRLFKTRQGDCEDYAIFAALCLEQAGYCTRVLNTWWGHGLMGHIVCVYEQDCRLWVLDRAPVSGVMPGISGPYDSYLKIGETIALESGGGPMAKYIWVYEWKDFLTRYRHFPLGESLI
ncbi:MAG: hypothetical protein GXP53_00810 [Deltaproteobacteria bacterium]|nr:hypothetical protein [Deltaproteobacteria bacterium]